MPCRGPFAVHRDEPVHDADVGLHQARERHEVPVHRLDRPEVAQLARAEPLPGVGSILALQGRLEPASSTHRPGQGVDEGTLPLQELDDRPLPAVIPVAAAGVAVHHDPVVGVDAGEHVLQAEGDHRGHMRLHQCQRDTAGGRGDRPRDPRHQSRPVDGGQFEPIPVGLVAVEVEELDRPAQGLGAVAEAVEPGGGVGGPLGDDHPSGARGEDGVEGGREGLGVGRGELSGVADEVGLDQDLGRDPVSEVVGDQREGLGDRPSAVIGSDDGDGGRSGHRARLLRRGFAVEVEVKGWGLAGRLGAARSSRRPEGAGAWVKSGSRANSQSPWAITTEAPQQQ